MSTHPLLRYWWHGQLEGSPEALIAWSRSARLLPLLGWRAQERGWPLPDDLLQAARRERYAETARQQLAHAQLQTLAALATEKGFTPLLVKGPVVAAAYPDPALRTYNDLDLLLPVEQAEPFMAALLRSGYRAFADGQRSYHLPPLRPPHQGYNVEIHTTLRHESGAGRFTFAELSEVMRPWQLTPGLFILEPVFHALYLVYHQLERHQLSLGVLPLADLYFWTHGWTGVEWATLAKQAAAAQLERSVRLALALTTWFWDEPWPTWVSERFPPPEPRVLDLGKQLVVGELGGRTPRLWRDLPEKSVRGWLTYGWMLLRGNPAALSSLSWQQRARFYLLRPFSLLKFHGPTLWRLLRGDRRTRATLHAQDTLTDWLNGARQDS
ncbi:MAG: nucleotidyltransferase family protein [Anaerolineae bacterium]|nr:nucleotidyltransferase family protein [Anaerolineae bacterium]